MRSAIVGTQERNKIIIPKDIDYILKQSVFRASHRADKGIAKSSDLTIMNTIKIRYCILDSWETREGSRQDPVEDFAKRSLDSLTLCNVRKRSENASSPRKNTDGRAYVPHDAREWKVRQRHRLVVNCSKRSRNKDRGAFLSRDLSAPLIARLIRSLEEWPTVNAGWK